MKELKFSTNKGNFLLVDDVDSIGRKLPYEFLTNIGYIKEITEEKASEVISSFVKDDNGNKSYVYSLYSLIKSKGINLFENPNYKQCGTIEWQETEQKTFYNPYLFKL